MSGELVWAVVRLLVALPVILALAYLVLKYGLGRRYMVSTGNRRLKLVEQLPLGPKTTLSLVGLGGKYYLLAHQDNAFSLVKELDKLPEPEGQAAADIVELAPQTISEFDQRRQADGPEVPEQQLKANQLAAWFGRVKDILKEKLAVREHPDK